MRDGSVVEFFAAQRRMIDIMTGVSATHPYSSLWYAWPAMTRPVWALFQVVGGNAGAWSAQHPALSIVGLANPFVFYPGEVAILFCLWLWIARREINGMIVAVAFFAQYLPWAVNPKGLEFFYYYFPSILCLGPALALAFFRGGAAARATARRSAFSSSPRSPSPSSCRSIRRSFRSIPTALPPASGSRAGADGSFLRRARRIGSLQHVAHLRTRALDRAGRASRVLSRTSGAPPRRWSFGGFSTFALLYNVQPLMPVFAREFAISPADRQPVAVGDDVVLAIAMLGAGAVADAFGRKRVMVASIAASSLATLLARAGAELADACLACARWRAWRSPACRRVAMAYLADEIDAQALGLAMGLYIAGSTLGGMAGRLVVGCDQRSLAAGGRRWPPPARSASSAPR